MLFRSQQGIFTIVNIRVCPWVSKDPLMGQISIVHNLKTEKKLIFPVIVLKYWRYNPFSQNIGVLKGNLCKGELEGWQNPRY
jgi:hypothetical protein